MGSKPERKRRILLVEDNLGDVLLLTEGFRHRAKIPDVINVPDGNAALAHLRAAAEQQTLPDIILLDLNMPGVDGRELLRILKDDPDLRSIPAIVLTGSDSEGDVRHVYDLQANGYLVKPNDLAGLQDLAALIDQYWFGNTRDKD